MSDRELEQIDTLLRTTMAQPPVPTLSSDFDRKLEKRLHAPARLGLRVRLTLMIYTLAALILSVWIMRREAVEWSLVVVAVAVPLVWLSSFLRRDSAS